MSLISEMFLGMTDACADCTVGRNSERVQPTRVTFVSNVLCSKLVLPERMADVLQDITDTNKMHLSGHEYLLETMQIAKRIPNVFLLLRIATAMVWFTSKGRELCF